MPKPKPKDDVARVIQPRAPAPQVHRHDPGRGPADPAELPVRAPVNVGGPVVPAAAPDIARVIQPRAPAPQVHRPTPGRGPADPAELPDRAPVDVGGGLNGLNGPNGLNIDGIAPPPPQILIAAAAIAIDAGQGAMDLMNHADQAWAGQIADFRMPSFEPSLLSV